MRLTGQHPSNVTLNGRVLAILGFLLQGELRREGGGERREERRGEERRGKERKRNEGEERRQGRRSKGEKSKEERGGDVRGGMGPLSSSKVNSM